MIIVEKRATRVRQGVQSQKVWRDFNCIEVLSQYIYSVSLNNFLISCLKNMKANIESVLFVSICEKWWSSAGLVLQIHLAHHQPHAGQTHLWHPRGKLSPSLLISVFIKMDLNLDIAGLFLIGRTLQLLPKPVGSKVKMCPLRNALSVVFFPPFFST